MSASRPSLRAIETFEAAARHGSFTQAAEELGVQQPAVSRQVRDLELALGARLFHRNGPVLRLSEAGKALQRGIASGLQTIDAALGAIREESKAPPLVVNVSIGIASCWLLARLAGFARAHPEADVQLVTSDGNFVSNPREVDVFVIFREEGDPNPWERVLFYETLFPVCAPQMIKDREPFAPDELREEKLLMLDSPLHRNDWTTLLGPHGITPPEFKLKGSYNSYIVYLQAILNGEGIGLGWKHLMDDLIAAGRLVPASDIQRHTRRAYYCCLTRRGADKPSAVAFSDWMTALAT